MHKGAPQMDEGPSSPGSRKADPDPGAQLRGLAIRVRLYMQGHLDAEGLKTGIAELGLGEDISPEGSLFLVLELVRRQRKLLEEGVELLGEMMTHFDASLDKLELSRSEWRQLLGWTVHGAS